MKLARSKERRRMRRLRSVRLFRKRIRRFQRELDSAVKRLNDSLSLFFDFLRSSRGMTGDGSLRIRERVVLHLIREHSCFALRASAFIACCIRA